MPKILMLMDWISAAAEEATIKTEASKADSFLIGVSLV
jgi:hypothetical protein